jgi:pimeloyl-ACP methyl ester carboxylesterase
MVKTKIIRTLKTGWLEEGENKKPILLMLHGYPDDPSTWDFQAEFFKSHFHVIRPFNRGVEPSEPSERISRYGLDGASSDLLDILQEIDPEKTRKIICVGHDLGAVLAWNLAPLLGARLSALIIFNGLSLNQFVRRFSSLQQQRQSWYIYFMQIPFLPEFLIKYSLKHKVGKISSALRWKDPKAENLMMMIWFQKEG